MRRESHRAAGVVVFRTAEQGRRYLLLRSALTRRPLWEFPKGGIEAGETEREAAERELREETGLSRGDYSIYDAFREVENYLFTAGSGDARSLIAKRVVYFLAEAYTDSVQISREATDFRWVGYPDAQRLLRFPEKRRVLEAAEQRLVSDSAPASTAERE